eukprot:3458258-Pyramimonas_sp.AAC.1
MHGRCGGRPQKEKGEGAARPPDAASRALHTGRHQKLPPLGHKLKAAQFIEKKLQAAGRVEHQEGPKPTEAQRAQIRPVFGM